MAEVRKKKVSWYELKDTIGWLKGEVEEVVRRAELALPRKCEPLLDVFESQNYIGVVIGEEGSDRMVRMWFRKDRVVYETVKIYYHGDRDWYIGDKHVIWVNGSENITCYQWVTVDGYMVARDLVRYALQIEEGGEEPREELGEGEGS